MKRLEQAFSHLGAPIPKELPKEHCVGMEGLLKEGHEIMSAQGDPTAKDAALIGAAQRVEHYEIAGYGTARTLAGELGYGEVEQLLNDTLDEEAAADKKLTKLATGGTFLERRQRGRCDTLVSAPHSRTRSRPAATRLVR